MAEPQNESKLVLAPYVDTDVITIGSGRQAMIQFSHEGERFIVGCNWPVSVLSEAPEFTFWVQESMGTQTSAGFHRDIRAGTPDDIELIRSTITAKLPFDSDLQSVVANNPRLREFLNLDHGKLGNSASIDLPGNYRT